MKINNKNNQLACMDTSMDTGMEDTFSIPLLHACAAEPYIGGFHTTPRW
jgi:hypothetical protein